MPRKQTIIEAAPKPSTEAILRFLRGMTPGRSQAGDGRERATAGLAGLTPADRTAVTTFHKNRAHADMAVEQQHHSEDAFVAPDGDKPTDTLEAMMGRPLHHDVISKMLRKLNPNFIFERSKNFPDIMGIYYPDPNAPTGKRFVLGFEFGYSPEFTVKHPDAKSAKKITRGWRAVLIHLTRMHYIELEKACTLFKVQAGRSSAHWQKEVAGLSR